MDYTLSPAGSPPDSHRLCPLCRTPHPDWPTRCFHCGAGLPLPEQAVQAEIAHISYLRHQLAGWPARGLVSQSEAARLLEEYSEQQRSLQAHMGRARSAAPNAPGSYPTIVPPLPAGFSPGRVTPPLAPYPPGRPLPAHLSPESPAAAETPETKSKAAAPPQPPAGVDLRGIALFLQEHALKLIFALATVLVLIALRSILGWSASNRIYLALLPLLPLGLTAMFQQFGRRTQEANPWAAFVYQGLVAVMAGFALFIVDRFWLTAFGLPLAPKPLTLLAALVTTSIFGLQWRRHHYPAMWHLLQAGLLTTLFCVLQCVKLLLWDQLNWRPTPLPLFGLVYLGAAAVYFGLALQNRRCAKQNGEKPLLGWTLWAHLSVTSAFGMSALGLALGHGVRFDSLLPVLFFAGLLYAVIAQALANTSLVYAASVLCLGSGLLWVANLHQGDTAYSGLFLLLSSAALALYRYNRGSDAPTSLSNAWGRVAVSADVTALFLTCFSIAATFHPAPAGVPNAMLLRSGFALVCGLQFVFLAVQENRSLFCYPACLSIGSALMGLLPALHNPIDRAPFTLADCLLPSSLLFALGAWIASRRGVAAGSGHDSRSPNLLALWREPLIDSGLFATTIVLGRVWLGIFERIFQPHTAWIAGGCVLASLLLAAARTDGARDTRRFGALALLNIAIALWVAHDSGITAATQGGNLAAWNRFAFGLLLQGYSIWVLARLQHNLVANEVWSETLTLLGVLTTALSGLVATIAISLSASQWEAGMTPPLVLIAGALSLVHLETLRSRRSEWTLLSVNLLLLADAALLISSSYVQPFHATVLATLSLLTAAGYLQLGRRWKESFFAALAAVPILAGLCMAQVMTVSHHLTAQDIMTARLIWTFGGFWLAWSYLTAAKWSGQSVYGYLSGITLVCAYLRAVTWTLPLSTPWIGIVLLPMLIAMAALSLNPPKGLEPVRSLYLSVAMAASVPALITTVLLGEGNPGALPLPVPNLVTGTLALYGAAYFTLARVRALPVSVVGASLWTLAYLNLLLSKTVWFVHGSPALTWPLFAFLFLPSALVWTGVGILLKRRAQSPAHTHTILTLAQAIALFSAVVACLHLTEQQSLFNILTLVWVGGIWFAHWLLDQGEICLHLGTFNLLIAWCVTLYHLLGAHTSLLDLYLLPFGVYLLLVGHQVSRRGKPQEAQTFWWIGLLTGLTPTLLTRWMHAPGWHASLLVGECTVCVLWGISHRIRAFVAAGLGTITIYATSVALGILPDAIATILTLLTGIGLFVFGFYALTHQKAIKRLMTTLQQRWTLWHTWR